MPNGDVLIVWNESFMTGSKMSSRIGIEARDANGSKIIKQYITAENSNSSFPVIFPVNANKVLIAFTENTKGKDQVLFEQVVVK